MSKVDFRGLGRDVRVTLLVVLKFRFHHFLTLWVMMLNQEVLNVPVLSALFAILLIGVVIEFQSGRLPNWLTFTGLLAGLVVAFFDNQWSTHLWGMLLGFVVPFTFFINGMAGGGFVKLMTAVGFIVGPIVTLTTTPVMIAVLIFIYLTDPDSITQESESEQSSKTIIHGSMISLIGSLIAVAWLYLL